MSIVAGAVAAAGSFQSSDIKFREEPKEIVVIRCNSCGALANPAVHKCDYCGGHFIGITLPPDRDAARRIRNAVQYGELNS